MRSAADIERLIELIEIEESASLAREQAKAEDKSPHALEKEGQLAKRAGRSEARSAEVLHPLS